MKNAEKKEEEDKLLEIFISSEMTNNKIMK